jgi:Bacterial SH3 domain
MAGGPGLRVEVPKAGEDKPHLGRVAIITVIGFVVGIAWPRIAGVKLAPSAPSDNEPAAAADEASGAAPQDSAPPAAKAAPAESSEGAPAPRASDRMRVADGLVVSCRDDKGKKTTSCDAIALDDVARPKILALAECPAAKAVEGTLSLGLEIDFGSGKVVDFQRGKSTNLAGSTADALIECAKKEFSTIALGDIKHEHAHYSIFYVAEFLAPGEKADTASASSTVTEASGHATVAWEVAIVREKPKDGPISARVMRGTRVTVTGRDGDWYRIKYDAKGTEGWVFRTAIGM